VRLRDGLLSGAVALTAVLLLTTSALADLRTPEGTAELAVALADDPDVRAAVTDALVEALLADAAERSPIAGGLLPLIRPLLEQAATTALESPAGRAALASALSDALRQLTFRGPLVVDLRTAVLVAAENAPEPLDTIARTAVERGSVGVVVIGGTQDDLPAGRVTPPGVDELGRIAGVPKWIALGLVGAVLIGLILAVARTGSATTRRRRLALAGVPLVVIGTTGSVLLQIAPTMVVERFTGSMSAMPESAVDVLPLLTDGLVDLLTMTTGLALVLVVLGIILSVVRLDTHSTSDSRPSRD